MGPRAEIVEMNVVEIDDELTVQIDVEIEMDGGKARFRIFINYEDFMFDISCLQLEARKFMEAK
jgi:hypothetical protein